MTVARWRYSDVAWGLTECARRGCSAAAFLLYDGEPCCVDHAETMIEREQALAIAPSLRETLPALDE